MAATATRTGREGVRIGFLTASLAFVAAGLIAVNPEVLAMPSTAQIGWMAALVGGFFVAERYVFDVEYRRQSIKFSLSEVPTAFAIVFLGPLAALAVRVLGSWLSDVYARGIDVRKDAFNASLFAAEIALASLVLKLLAPSGSSDARTIVAVGVAVGAASLLSAAATSLLIAIFEGGFGRQLRLHIVGSAGLPFLGPVLGMTAIAGALLHPALALIPVIPLIVMWNVLRSHGDLGQRHRDLEALHDFTRAVNGSLDLASVTEAARSEVQRLLRARVVSLSVRGPGGRRLSDATLPSGAIPADIAALAPESATDVVLLGADHPDVTTRNGWTDALLAPVRDNEGHLGHLLVVDRVGGQARFSIDDVRRMRALADQVAVSVRKALLHMQLEHEATHDRLTGLPNRALFERSITAVLDAHDPVAVFLLDLDRFKEVNDGLGHHVGDVLLRKFADRVVSVVGPGAVVSRLAGDEFAIMASGMTRHQAGELGSRILAAARDPFDLGELSVAVSCSIGLALGPAHGEDATTLLRRADLAMYEAKGRSGGVSVYRGDLETTSTQRLRLLQDLRVAAVDEQMQAWFQPKVHLRTNAVVGVETLVRWHHPEQGVLEADRFIGLAEQTDLIHTITDRMLTSALTTARSWRRRGWALGVAVNVSARSLLDELLADRIARHLHQHDVPAEMLTIEITETSVMADVSRALVTLDRLSDLGVQLSVDDYGTGYSSLTYLRKLPVSELKIDRGFIATMLTDEHDEVIVRSTIDLGRHLGLRVVAEGIESPEIAGRLRDLGCDIGQGAGFAAPLPADQLERWLEDGPYIVPGADGEPGALATA